MKDYVITTSSTCDLGLEHLKKNGIDFTSFNYQVDGENFKDNFFKDKPKEEFFDMLPKHNVSTSQPSPEDFVSMWEKYVMEGKDIFHIELSSGISGGFNSANLAKAMIEEKYKDARVIVIDSLGATAGLGLLVDIASEKKSEGLDIDSLEKFIEDIKNHINIYFFSNDLSQFFKGGRISKASFSIGSLLGIVPLMHVRADGALDKGIKTRGYINAINKLVDIMKNDVGIDYKDKVYIAHSDCIDLANKTALAVNTAFSNVNITNEDIYEIGTVIGTHTGRGTVALSYIGAIRVDK